jgi:3-hydroxyacyl-CoA dehydrogenase
MSSTTFDKQGNIAVITLNNPPVNGLGLDLRQSIVASIHKANEDKSIEAIVMIGSDRAFSGGADIREFGSPKSYAEPNLLSVIKVVEGSSKPVIAAIGGVCMGGGLELAMGAHYRVSTPDAKLALPEIKLGLMPGAGGTQRFPRVVGLEHALNFILKGDPVPAKQFKGTALIDEYIEQDLLKGAIAFATKVVK